MIKTKKREWDFNYYNVVEYLKIIKTINNDSITAKHDKEYDIKYYKGSKKSVMLSRTIAYILVNTIGIDKAQNIGDNVTIIGFIGAVISFVFLLILNGLGNQFYLYIFYILVSL